MSFTTALRCPTCTAPNDKKVKCPCRGIGPSFSPFTAAELGDLNTVVKFLEKYGRDVDKEDSGGYTMLHYAAQHNRAKVVEYLCKKKANLNSHSCGATPLHRAAYAGSIDCVKLLVAAGADVFQRDTTSYGKSRTAIHKAADQGHTHIVDFLLHSNENLTALVDTDGQSYRELLHIYKNDKAANKFNSSYIDVGLSVQKRNSSSTDTDNGKNQFQSFGIACPECGTKTLALARRPCCKSLACTMCNKSCCNNCNKSNVS
mmetsp:Transcript_13324/g.17272  ORF Transcript_13324/g.17272 Transcript_13324/m.17272 type:complete len:259 (-) Transcript_13324:218-994(-)